MYILGISAFYHDSAASLIRDGVLVAAAQEERFTRKKHDHRFPKQALDYCLHEAGIRSEDLDCVVFYDKPWLKFERLLETYLAFAPSGLPSFLKAMPLWLKQKLWMTELIQRETGFSGDILFPEHHQSHGASAFYPSPYQSAAILTLDGVGEWATASWGQGVDHRIELKGELRFPHSLGLLYSAVTYYTGFRVNSGEYKVMGLAPYGEPKYKKQLLDEVVDLRDDGSFRLDMSYFNYCQGLTMTSKKFHRQFGGPPRRPESVVTQKEMDLARSVQEVTEEIMLKMARHARRMTGEKYCCLAGGVALNCVANGLILREKIFDDIWIQPAAGDAGGALGAALFAWHHVLGNPRSAAGNRDSQFGSYLGPSFKGADIEKSLRKRKIPYHRKKPQEVSRTGAALLADGKVLGWFSGRMEFGPRALGARSILGDARSTKMQSMMNLKIKFRESFRPFAPACLLEDVSEFFELDRASPYMLLVASVRLDRRIELSQAESRLFGIEKLSIPRSDIPAVTHVDYSARVQTVDRETHPAFYDLISAFKQETGYGVVVNTSFNVRGEPIVCTPEDAYLCFMRTEMDALMLENCLLLKEEQAPIEEAEDWRDLYALD